MEIFFKIFDIFKKNKPQKRLLEAYSKLNELSKELSKDLNYLRNLQKEIISEIAEKQI